MASSNWLSHLIPIAILAINADSAVAAKPTISPIYTFQGAPDGAVPEAALTQMGDLLYGTTTIGGTGTACDGGCGTVFSIASDGTEKTIYSFQAGQDGRKPATQLVAYQGVLYGTTSFGGAGCAAVHYYTGCGTIFSVTPAGQEKVLYDFPQDANGNSAVGNIGPLTEMGGILYGITQGGVVDSGVIYSITPAGLYTAIHTYPYMGPGVGALGSYIVPANNLLYGDIAKGSGGQGQDAIFAMTADGSMTVLYTFKKGTLGYGVSFLTSADGNLFGTTVGGSKKGLGATFKVSLSGSGTELAPFSGFEGYNAFGGVTVSGRDVFGISGGGHYGESMIYKVPVAGGKMVSEYSFNNAENAPSAAFGPLVKFHGQLYGVTAGGGPYNELCGYDCGTIYIFNK